MPRRASIGAKSAGQILKMRAAGLVVGRTLQALREAARPGVTTAELDQLARERIAEAGAVSSFLGYGAGFGLPPFPAVTCISVNSEIVHGIPGDRVLVDGDLVSVDFGVSLDAWHGDSAITFVVGAGSAPAEALSEATRQAMWAGIAAARVGGRIGDIGHAVETSIRSNPARAGFDRIEVSTAWPISPMRPPTRAAAMPAHMACRVASLSASAGAEPAPTTNVIAESPCQASRDTPKSTLTRSPSTSTRSPGMPCTISEFTEMQVTAGNGGSPKPAP